MTDLKPVYLKIDFLNKYKELCSKHNDFDNRLRGTNITGISNQYSLQLNLILKDGIVDVLLYI